MYALISYTYYTCRNRLQVNPRSVFRLQKLFPGAFI